MQDVTAITVTYNTPDLYRRMYEAFRSFHPDMPLVVIDNKSKNIGHGKGLHYGIGMATTPYVLIMDTDTVILKDPVPEMRAMMTTGVYGVGCVTYIGRDGYDFGAFKHHRQPIPYLHPFFALICKAEYYKYQRFVHHGAPWYKTAVDIYDKGDSHKLKHFHGLKAFDYGEDGTQIATRTEYVFHDFGGTRKANKKRGEEEVALGWEF